MLLIRRIFFYLFILAYLIYCPVLIFYALGYIVRPGENQAIVKSGLVYLSTAPSGATVYLGNRKYFRKTPTVLNDLIPGTYEVKLTRKKYKPWTKTVPVEAGKATVLERILLLPNQWKAEKLISEPFGDLIPIPGSRFLILAKGERAEDLFIYDRKLDELQKLFPVYSPFGKARVMKYFFTEKSPNFLLRLDAQTGEKFLWVTPRFQEIRTKEITALFSDQPEHIEWDPSERKILFSLQNGYLDALSISDKISRPKFISDLLGFGVHERKIYALKNNFTVERFNSRGEAEKVLFNDVSLGRKLFSKEFYQIKILSEDLILFLGEDGSLIANRFPYQFLEEGLMGLQFDSKQDRLLVWTKEAIGVVHFVKAKPDTAQIFDSGAQLAWIYQKGNKIAQAFWVFEGSHILFRDQNKIYLAELETYGKPNLYELLEVYDKSSIDYDEDSGNLYYLEKTTGHLSSLELLPRNDLLTLPFPERKTERKKIQIGTL